MLKPKLLLLDEPSLGLSPNYVDIVFEKIKAINRNGTTILIVEQNARMTLRHSLQTVQAGERITFTGELNLQ